MSDTMFTERQSLVNLKKALMVIVIILCLAPICFAGEQTKIWANETDLINATYIDVQMNRNPASTCDASRYISTGYDYPGTDTNPAGLCNRCDGAGGTSNVPNGQDTFNDCPSDTCAGTACNGAGSCQFLAAGKQGCSRCQYCTGNSVNCANVPNGQDTYGECPGTAGDCAGTTCNGAGNCVILPYGKGGCTACQYCSGSSRSCSYVTSGQDTFEECPGVFGTCAGSTCQSGHCQYLSGKQGCATCKYCTGSSFSCQNVGTNTDPYNDCASSSCATGLCDGVGHCVLFKWAKVYVADEEVVSGSPVSCGPAQSGNYGYAAGSYTTLACTTTLYDRITATPGAGSATWMRCQQGY